jgi:transaldolase
MLPLTIEGIQVWRQHTMGSDYFHKLTDTTPTRFWVNNPNAEEMERAIDAGAISCTTNPAYCSKLLKSELHEVHGVIDRVIATTDDDDQAADLVYQECAARIMRGFLPLHEQSSGVDGWVTIQDDPRRDEDASAIMDASLRHAELGKNYMAKIPVIPSGTACIEELIRQNIAVCATEMFSVAQTAHICELYQRVSRACGKKPVFYVTHITGIFDEYLKGVAQRDGIDIDPGILNQAGCIVARKVYRLIQDRGYDTTLLGGGARGMHHFTEFVGGDFHVTINWSTAREIMDTDIPVVPHIDAEASAEVVEELRRKLSDFRKAYDDDGLSPEEFQAFGPVQHFRNEFIKGYNHLVSEVANRRMLLNV